MNSVSERAADSQLECVFACVCVCAMQMNDNTLTSGRPFIVFFYLSYSEAKFAHSLSPNNYCLWIQLNFFSHYVSHLQVSGCLSMFPFLIDK